MSMRFETNFEMKLEMKPEIEKFFIAFPFWREI